MLRDWCFFVTLTVLMKYLVFLSFIYYNAIVFIIINSCSCTLLGTLRKHNAVYYNGAWTTVVLFPSCSYRFRWFQLTNNDPPIYSVNGGWKGKQKLDTKMPKFRETRKQLLYAHCNNLIHDEEFLLL